MHDTVNALSHACDNLSSGKHQDLTSAFTGNENTVEPKFWLVCKLKTNVSIAKGY